MTIIAQQDYPDYGRQVSQSDIVVFDELNTPITGDTTLPARFVGSSPWLDINFSSAATRSRIFFQWSLDEARTITLGSDVVVIRFDAQARVTLPVRGPWVNAFIQLSAYPDDFFLTATTVPHPIGSWSEAIANRIIGVFGANIGAGANVIFTPNVVRSGWVTISAQIRTGAVATAALRARRFDGTTTLLDRWRIPAFAPERRIYVPPMPVELDVTNNDAETQALDAVVSAGTPGMP